ncbi:flagellar biosynthetic protein FliR [Desulfoluna butyratoxydans]|uniref:Flagellar biosynthetic protein FliR n=1 Tax=Desulfoluna butyratoxydans TaxID=231438 RepID=A0A4U8YN54_9BACT|nr:flagellar biosynthetic protein FliR [Desulfoluna butyratoxydans]VFQ42633.1 flagellar biosynthesis protein flir [Desulfoluna butyratoxydans]
MEILNFPTAEFRIFLLVLLRVSTLLFLFPFFGSPVIPVRVKTALSLVLAFTLWPVAAKTAPVFPHGTVPMVITMGAELILGMCLALSARLFFAAIQLAGGIISFQMGFSMINTIDPQSGSPMAIMSQVGYLVATLLFLAFGGHHVVITALADSFFLVKPGGLLLTQSLWNTLETLVSAMFTVGIRVAAPTMVALFFTSCAFGMCARFVPQMNVLVLAFPVKIAVGLFLFGLTLQVIHIMVGRFVGDYATLLTHMLEMMGGTRG